MVHLAANGACSLWEPSQTTLLQLSNWDYVSFVGKETLNSSTCSYSPQFLETISQHWSLDIYRSHMYILCNKLKHLKGRLKSLNNLHFSHISERVARAGKELDETQLLLQNDRDNGDLLAL